MKINSICKPNNLRFKLKFNVKLSANDYEAWVDVLDTKTSKKYTTDEFVMTCTKTLFDSLLYSHHDIGNISRVRGMLRYNCGIVNLVNKICGVPDYTYYEDNPFAYDIHNFDDVDENRDKYEDYEWVLIDVIDSFIYYMVETFYPGLYEFE